MVLTKEQKVLIKNILRYPKTLSLTEDEIDDLNSVLQADAYLLADKRWLNEIRDQYVNYLFMQEFRIDSKLRKPR